MKKGAASAHKDGLWFVGAPKGARRGGSLAHCARVTPPHVYAHVCADKGGSRNLKSALAAIRVWLKQPHYCKTGAPRRAALPRR